MLSWSYHKITILHTFYMRRFWTYRFYCLYFFFCRLLNIERNNFGSSCYLVFLNKPTDDLGGGLECPYCWVGGIPWLWHFSGDGNWNINLSLSLELNVDEWSQFYEIEIEVVGFRVYGTWQRSKWLMSILLYWWKFTTLALFKVGILKLETTTILVLRAFCRWNITHLVL